MQGRSQLISLPLQSGPFTPSQGEPTGGATEERVATASLSGSPAPREPLESGIEQPSCRLARKEKVDQGPVGSLGAHRLGLEPESGEHLSFSHCPISPSQPGLVGLSMGQPPPQPTRQPALGQHGGRPGLLPGESAARPDGASRGREAAKLSVWRCPSELLLAGARRVGRFQS